MDKKTLIGIIAAIVVILAAGVTALYFFNRLKNNADQTTDNNTNISEDQEGDKTVDKKILVVYYSAQNHTKTVAEQIAEDLQAELFEIVPKEIYTAEDLDWTADDSRVNREHENEALRDIALTTTEVPNWSKYDTILLGYPIWWGIAAWPVDNFVKANDFNGKTVIPFCTSTSSGLGQSGELLAEMANGGNWLAGHRFSSNPSASDIQT